MKKRFLLLIPFFIACSSEESNTSLTGIEKEVTVSSPPISIKHEKREKEEDILNQFGFEIKDQKIIIDMNKTTHFFEMLEEKMESKAKEIEKQIQNSELNITEESVGVTINNDSISIDLNRTKGMFEKINILMKDIILDINGSQY